jgi:hypothetical protein
MTQAVQIWAFCASSNRSCGLVWVGVVAYQGTWNAASARGAGRGGRSGIGGAYPAGRSCPGCWITMIAA